MTTPDETPDTTPVFPEGVDNDTPIRDVINAFTSDHRTAILTTEDSLTASYNSDNMELDDMMEDIQDQITTASDDALALLKSGYDATRADLLMVQDTLDGVKAWIAGTLGEAPEPQTDDTPVEDDEGGE